MKRKIYMPITPFLPLILPMILKIISEIPFFHPLRFNSPPKTSSKASKTFSQSETLIFVIRDTSAITSVLFIIQYFLITGQK